MKCVAPKNDNSANLHFLTMFLIHIFTSLLAYISVAILCRIIGMSHARMKEESAFLHYLPQSIFLTHVAVGKPGFCGISMFLVYKIIGCSMNAIYYSQLLISHTLIAQSTL